MPRKTQRFRHGRLEVRETVLPLERVIRGVDAQTLVEVSEVVDVATEQTRRELGGCIMHCMGKLNFTRELKNI